MSLKAKAETLATKRGEFKTFWDAIEKDDTGTVKAITPEQTVEFNQRNDELKTIQDEYTALKRVQDAADANAAELKSLAQPQRGFQFQNGRHPKDGPEEPGTKRLSDYFLESGSYKSRRDEQHGFSESSVKSTPMQVEAKDAALKTLLATTTGFAPFVPRSGLIVPLAQRRPMVADLIPQIDTTDAGIRYIEETLFTHAAAATAEGAIKPELALAYAERFLGMTKIAVTIPVTEEQMMDVPQLRAIIDDRMTLDLQLEEERELLQGNPGGANTAEFIGFLNKTGVQQIPKGVVDDFSAVLKAIIQIENTIGFANVSGGVMHPLDWYAFRTKQDSTGRFIMGDPGMVGPATLWGKTFIPTIAEPQGSILLGDFQRFSQIVRREGITFRVGYVNDQFIRNIMTIIAEMRELLVITRPSAFGVVTGTF